MRRLRARASGVSPLVEGWLSPKAVGGDAVGRQALGDQQLRHRDRPRRRELPVAGEAGAADRAAVGMAVDPQHPGHVGRDAPAISVSTARDLADLLLPAFAKAPPRRAGTAPRTGRRSGRRRRGSPAARPARRADARRSRCGSAAAPRPARRAPRSAGCRDWRSAHPCRARVLGRCPAPRPRAPAARAARRAGGSAARPGRGRFRRGAAAGLGRARLRSRSAARGAPPLRADAPARPRARSAAWRSLSCSAARALGGGARAACCSAARALGRLAPALLLAGAGHRPRAPALQLVAQRRQRAHLLRQAGEVGEPRLDRRAVGLHLAVERCGLLPQRRHLALRLGQLRLCLRQAALQRRGLAPRRLRRAAAFGQRPVQLGDAGLGLAARLLLARSACAPVSVSRCSAWAVSPPAASARRSACGQLLLQRRQPLRAAARRQLEVGEAGGEAVALGAASRRARRRAGRAPRAASRSCGGQRVARGGGALQLLGGAGEGGAQRLAPGRVPAPAGRPVPRPGGSAGPAPGRARRGRPRGSPAPARRPAGRR